MKIGLMLEYIQKCKHELRYNLIIPIHFDFSYPR